MGKIAAQSPFTTRTFRHFGLNRVQPKRIDQFGSPCLVLPDPGHRFIPGSLVTPPQSSPSKKGGDREDERRRKADKAYAQEQKKQGADSHRTLRCHTDLSAAIGGLGQHLDVGFQLSDALAQNSIHAGSVSTPPSARSLKPPML